jgi:hypothetical protein
MRQRVHREWARESLNSTLKRNRAVRVQIVNGNGERCGAYARATGRAACLFSLCAMRAMSSTLMRLNATPNSSSALAKAGSTVPFNSSEPRCGFSLPSTVPGRAQDIIGRHPPALAGECITAARAADAAQDAVADQRLQHGFEMPRRQAMPRRKLFRGNRMRVRLQCHVDDGSNCQDTFAREQRHVRFNVARGE